MKSEAGTALTGRGANSGPSLGSCFRVLSCCPLPRRQEPRAGAVGSGTALWRPLGVVGWPSTGRQPLPCGLWVGAALAGEPRAAPGAGGVDVTPESAGCLLLVEIKTSAKAGPWVVCASAKERRLEPLPCPGLAPELQQRPPLLEDPRRGVWVSPSPAQPSRCWSRKSPRAPRAQGRASLVCAAARARRRVSRQRDLTQRQPPWKPVEMIYLVPGRGPRLRGSPWPFALFGSRDTLRTSSQSRWETMELCWPQPANLRAPS